VSLVQFVIHNNLKNWKNKKMKCYICNKTLKLREIKFHKIGKFYEPCTSCLNISRRVFREGITVENYGDPFVKFLLDSNSDKTINERI
jgi:late competence protein required for DNA uptake (superfamily II DNA/RNA helicase)